MSTPFEQQSGDNQPNSNGFDWNNPSNESNQSGSGSEVSLDRTFQTGTNCRLTLDNPRGLIQVVGWDRPEVHVRATKLPDSSQTRFNATRIVAEQQGNAVMLRTILDPAGAFDPSIPQSIAQEIVRAISDFIQQRKPAAVEYDVHVPRNATLDLKTVSADVEVKDVGGAVRTSAVSGSTTLEQVSGEVGVNSVSGNVAAQGLSGRVDLNTVSGDVNLVGELDRARVNTVSGGVELTGPLNPTGSYDFHSVSGAVTLRIPETTSASIAVRGVSADVSGDVPMQVLADRRGPGHREWQGRMDGGSASIRFQTVSGRMRLLRWSEPANWSVATSAPTSQNATETAPSSSTGASSGTSSFAPPAPEPTAPPEAAATSAASAESATESSENEQLKILRALEHGEMNVAEALRRLEELKGA